MALLLAFAFLSGLVTILAPCIWPLLPIILSVSTTANDHKKPLGITLGIIISFGVVTLAVSSLVRAFHLDPNILRLIAVLVIGFLGLTMLVPQLSNGIELAVSRLSALFGNQQIKGGGFIAGFLTGLSLGVVWSPCAGPILAAIAALAATGKVTIDVILVTLAYVLGVGIPLFLFSYAGQAIFTKTRSISQHLGLIQRFFGIIMILTAIAIYTNYDVYLQSQLLNAFPQLNLTSIENNSFVQNQLNLLKNQKTPQMPTSEQSGLFNADQTAPDFTGITTWLNSTPLSLEKLKGKVVLVDFWTYTCINCIRTLPHLTHWYEKYKNDGFVIVGVHTPEFAFEHDTENVRHAISMFDISYPVAQDNNYATWNNYNNQFWPAEYLIDANGMIRRIHFGEGEYDTTEQAIQALLRENGKTITAALDTMPDQTPTMRLSPESYLGTSRMQYEYPDGETQNGTQTFTKPTSFPQDHFAFGGTWNITPDNAISQIGSTLSYHFFANKVFLVIRPGSNVNPTVKVFLDGNPVDSTNQGADVKNGIVTIDSDRLYNLIDLKGKNGSHTLKLEFENGGTEVFAFTFG